MQITAKEVAWRNRLIIHCEGLLQSKGTGGTSRAQYTSSSFLITLQHVGARIELRVQYSGLPVMHAKWDADDDPGTVYMVRGPWQTDLLSLRPTS